MKKFINAPAYLSFKHKIQYFSLFLLLFFSFQPLSGQVPSLCGTEISPGYSVPQINLHGGDPLGLRNANDPYIIRVYFHILRDDNGMGGQDKSVVPAILQNMNTAFTAHNISFVSTCHINEIKSTPLFDASPLGAAGEANLASMKTSYGHSDGIDIFLGKDQGVAPGGLSILPGTAAWVAGTFTDIFAANHILVQGEVVSHEIGHCLGLYHTWHNTESLTNPLREYVNSNSSTTGDMIADTEADPGIIYGYMEWAINSGNFYTTLDANCNWLPDPAIADSNGDLFMPDPSNIMAYTIPSCMTKFSTGQGNVMRYNLLNIPELTDCLVGLGNDRVIAQNTTETWTLADADANGDIFIADDVIIEDGATLSISSGVKVHFTGGSSLIIEPNALLSLYGTLTSTDGCGQWNGVVVSGDNGNYSQFYVNGRYEQGRLKTYSTAMIENALVAVKLYTEPYPQNAGGQIDADGTTFRNNAYGVVFKPFDNFYPYPTSQQGQPRDYRGSFTDCHFETTSAYDLSDDFHSFIDMAGVKGIRAYACSFTNSLILDNATEIADYGYGIKAHNSKFSVLPICSSPTYPCTSYSAVNSFDGLGYAIHVSTAITAQPYIVKAADFRNCYIGVNNQGISNATLIFNKFYMGNLPDLSVDTNMEPGVQNDQLGVLLEYDTDGYTLQENEFIKEAGGNIESANVGFTIGILSSATGQFSNEIRKNTFEGAMTSSDGVFIGNMAQKSNGGGGTGLVFLCNDYHDGGFADMYVPQDVPVLNTINRHQRGYDVINDINLASGNTFDNSNSSFVHTAAQYFTYYSTNALDEVLVNPFGVPNYDIESTNTCSSTYCEPPCKTKTEIDMIKSNFPTYKNAEILSKSAYDLALAGGNTIQIEQTATTYAADKQKVDKATFDIVLYTLYDETYFNNQELETWLLNKQAYGTDILLATEKQLSGNTTEASNILGNMLSRFDITTEQMTDMNQLSTLFGILQGQSVYNLGANTLSSLEVLAANEAGISSAIARNLLTYHGYNFTPRYVIDTGGNKSLSISKEENNKKNSKVAVYPNPASTQVNFAFNFDDKKTATHQLEIVDIGGKILVSHNINNDSVEYIWDTTTVSDGIYFYRIYSEGVNVESGKILIHK